MRGRNLSPLAVIIILIVVSIYLSFSGNQGLAETLSAPCKVAGEKWSYDANQNLPPFDCCSGLKACPDGYCCGIENKEIPITGQITGNPSSQPAETATNNPGNPAINIIPEPLESAYACYQDSDCGTEGWIGSSYCKNNDVYQKYRTYVCNNAGTENAECSHSDEEKRKEECGENVYRAWSNPYCKNDDVWQKREFTEMGCLSGYCFSNTGMNERIVEVCFECSGGECVDGNNFDTPPTSKVITCHQNSDCGTEGWVGSSYCKNGDVWQEWRSYTCHSPGTGFSYCSHSDKDMKKQDCSEGCSEGGCSYTVIILDYACYKDSDCGTDGWLEGQDYCSGGGGENQDIWGIYRNYTCHNPGTSSAYCTHTDTDKLKEDCGDTEYGPWGDPYCYDNDGNGEDVYHLREAWWRGCDQYGCYLGHGADIEKLEECGGKACVDGECVNTPPSIDSYSPTYNPTIDVGESQTFSITKSDPDGDPLTVKWYVDDVLKKQGSDSYTYTATAAGTYEVKVVVSDGTDSVNHKWTLTVNQAGNNPPSIDSYSPTYNPTIDVGESQTFSITKSDPDGDPLTVKWYVDGSQKTQGADSYSYIGTMPGNFEIMVTVYDGEYTVSHTWTLTVNKPLNRPPSINSYSPTSDPTINMGQSQMFSISKSDPDGDSLTVKWYVDGSQKKKDSDSFTYTPTSAGTYKIEVTVSDGWETVSHEWTLTVKQTGDLPDLKVSNLVVIWPPNPKAGEITSFEFKIKNVGNKKAENVKFRLLTGESNKNSQQGITLDLGEEIYVAYDHTYNNPGTHTVTAIVDPDDQISESNENNNQMSITVVVT
jgi:hypothetical protein